MPDPDFEIRGARSSRPRDKGGRGWPVQKKIFGSSGLSLVEK